MNCQIEDSDVLALAQLEAETQCDISAGVDLGIHLGQYLSQMTHTIDPAKILVILVE